MRHETKFDINPESNMQELPITIDFKPGRAEKGKNRTLWTIVSLILILLIFISILFQPEHNFITNFIVAMLWLSLTLTILRFGYLKEHKIRNQMLNNKVNDYKIDTYGFWGILSIDNAYPHICRFRGKKSGLYVSMEKGVTSGNMEETKNNHREAMGKFLHYMAKTSLEGVAGNGLNVTHIDCMDFVGKDERIDLMIKNNQRDCELPTLQKILEKVYLNLKQTSQSKVYTSDIFVFTWKGRDDINISTIKEALNILLRGGYTSYHFMDTDELQDLYKTLFNVMTFSVHEGNATAQGDLSNKKWITPIRVVNEFGGVTTLNLTRQEKLHEREVQRERRQRQKEQKRNKDKEQGFIIEEIYYKTEDLARGSGYTGYVDPDELDISEEELSKKTFKF